MTNFGIEALVIQRFRSLRVALEDQHQVANIDDVRGQLADDDNWLALDQAVYQRQQPAADREEPERQRHDAFSSPLARDPLHQKASGKGQLRNKAEGQPEVELGDKNVVDVVAECLPVLDQHYFTSLATGVGFLRRISHHTPARSMIPIHSRSKKP